MYTEDPMVPLITVGVISFVSAVILGWLYSRDSGALRTLEEVVTHLITGEGSFLTPLTVVPTLREAVESHRKRNFPEYRRRYRPELTDEEREEIERQVYAFLERLGYDPQERIKNPF